MTFLEIGFIIRVEADGGEGVSGLLWRRDFLGWGCFVGVSVDWVLLVLSGVASSFYWGQE